MDRVLLILPSATYRAPDFLAAARELGVTVTVASERRAAMSAAMGERALTLRLSDPGVAAEQIAERARETPFAAVVGVDDQGVMAAALGAERLGLSHNPPEAVARTRDKAAMRRALAEAGVPQPRFAVLSSGADVAAVAREVGLPCVIKPLALSGSRGVIRANDPEQACSTVERVRGILAAAHQSPQAPLLLESYQPGTEVALEGLLRGGRLEVLAVFDKPDPLEGPYFEETLYVTPSRLSADVLAEVEAVTARAVQALGLREGPVHAELRVDGERVCVLELAARSIGGLCSRALRFGAGVSLEQVILRHALGLRFDDLALASTASGVMMIPIPGAGVLQAVEGQQQARAVEGIDGLEITIGRGRPVVPLPEGDRYLGFMFARAASADAVERSLRTAHARLRIRIEPHAPEPVGAR
ncbi:MAG TPA: ATP-grasp domain-containing protein [Solirubrobacteraceae bacterium]|nr:ATP-grasp domain-containing protein [Solirubrobacteraceae bacterium]